MSQEDVKAIRELIDAYCNSIRAGSAAAAIERLAPKVTLYELAPPLEYRDGAARDPRQLERWFATWEGPIEIELPDPTIAVDGDVAFAFGLARMRGVKKPAGREAGGKVDLWYRVTICLQRERGMWKVVHEHASVPFLMDGSDKAALDLKPEISF